MKKKQQKSELTQLVGVIIDRLKKAVQPNPNSTDPMGCRFDWHTKGYSVTPSAK